MKRNPAPTISNTRPGRPTSYRAEYCDRIIQLMAEGRSLDGCAALLGVHPDSLNEWQRVHPEFSVAVRAGRAAATAFWEGRLPDVAQGGSGNAQTIQWDRATAHGQPQAGTTRILSLKSLGLIVALSQF